MHTAQDKARDAATTIYTLDRAIGRADGQDKVILTTKAVQDARNLIWSLLERLAEKQICQACEVPPAFDIDKWMFVESRDNPLAAAAAVNLVKESKRA